MAQIRMLVSEMNSERARLDRSLTMASDDTSSGAVAVQSQAAVRREALVAALDRVRDDTYGVCDRCGKDIPFGRLLVMPEVTHCVGC